MNLFIYLLCLTCLLNQVIIVIAGKKGNSNIVLSGGSGGGGCKGSGGGGGALVMESSGKKGKKSDKLIMKDDALIMQNGEADGNIILDGNNLVFKEGKKDENIIIKGNSGQCCQEDTHHKEEHIHMPPPLPIAVHLKADHSQEHRTYVPVPVHFKKKVEHHHHTKEVHHHNDDMGLGSRRKDTSNDAVKNEDEYVNEQSEKGRTKKRKFKSKKMKIHKLKLGDKLSLKEKEHLKLKRVDRRLGLSRFKLAGKMMQKMRWRKNAQKTNSSSLDKSKEEVKQQEQSTKDDVQSESTADQQYEDEETEDSGRDQEDETSNSNLYEGLTNAMYPVLNPAATGYMTSAGFSNVMDLYPPVSQPAIVPASQPTASASDRRDLKKKYGKNKAKKIKKLDNVKEQTKEDNDQKSGDEKLDLDQSEELSGDEEDNSKLSKSRSADGRGIKSINHNEITTALPNLLLKNNNYVQPIFALDERQLTSPLYPLLALTTNVNQRLAVPNQHPLNHYPHHHQNSIPTATLPLFAPAKSFDRSAALLLELIGHQSNEQQKLIFAQHKKLLEQEAKHKELSIKLQQATEERNEKLKNASPKPEYKDKADYFNGLEIYEGRKNRNKLKLFYASELDHSDKLESDENDKLSINRLNRRKNNLNKFDQSKQALNKRDEQFSREANVSNDEFDFSNFDEAPKLESNKRLNRQQPFAKRMYTEPTENSKLVDDDAKTKDNNSTNHSDYKSSTMKLAKNASLIVYGY